MLRALRWFPWKYLVSRMAQARGLVDPIKVLSRLESFAQPLELKEPLELLRAGMVFHARGLLNTSAIQHNLDWVWPYWVERQYDPKDVSFIPRAFSITHVNLTHRNWTAVGLPDVDELPIVDPRGLVTPFWDGWSLDAWVLADDGRRLYPSRLLHARQDLVCCDGPDSAAMAVTTRAERSDLVLDSRAEVRPADGGEPVLAISYTATADAPGWLAVALRPYNPEGVSFVHRLALAEGDGAAAGWLVEGTRRVAFSEAADAHRFSTYSEGDVQAHLPQGAPSGGRSGGRSGRGGGSGRTEVRCDVGMATAAALFRLEADCPRRIEVTVPLGEGKGKKLFRKLRGVGGLGSSRKNAHGRTGPTWPQAVAGVCRLETPDRRARFLWDAAVRTLVLHSPGDVYPGPYTYKRFWFRDASFILHALACIGLADRVERTLATFPGRQTRAGFFKSQEGEWDSNGEALWIVERHHALTGRPVDPSWRGPVEKGARWIVDMRVDAGGDALHAGLLPAGFSAEHLGPNDYYYWDDFWGVAGLRSAAALLEALGEAGQADGFRREADDLSAAIDRSIGRAAERLGRRRPEGVPASPYRRLDAGAIGSLAASYPLALWAPDDPRMAATADYLATDCLVDGGFFQDVIHSGINPYLTLHLAQVLLRSGDPRGLELVRTVARLASPTGQWPEAIHPRTGGGCMGDGHHVWAAAEWMLAVRNAFVREEGDGLVLAAGILPEWLGEDGRARLGPAPTPWGPVTVEVSRPAGGAGDELEVEWSGDWRGAPPPVEVRPPAVGTGRPEVAAGMP